MEEPEEEVYNTREWEIDNIPLSCSIVMIGAPQSGKGTLMEDILYFNRHRIPVCRAFSGSETQYKRLKAVTHPLYCSNYYDSTEEKQYIVRQRTLALEEGAESNQFNNSINIIDDVGDDPKVFDTQELRGLFKIGTQHWNHILVVANQYAIDFPPAIRKSITYACLFNEPSPTEREKLFKNFGGICGVGKEGFERFNKLMDQLTGDYTCMVIGRSQSSKIEDNIFWFRTKVLTTNWKFGCAEYQEWANARYNKNYKEQVKM
jgi:hypothetical protein